jgi:hypothetical protein
VYYQSPANMWLWVRSSAEIAAGYSSAMSLDGPPGVLVLAALSALTLAALFVTLTGRTRALLLLFVAPAFLAFKHGFVRQGGHSMAYFSAMSMIPVVFLAAPALPDRDIKRLLLGFSAFFAIAVIYGANYLSYPALRWADFRSLLTLRTGYSNLSAVVRLEHTRAALRDAAAQTLRSSVLPAEWQKRLDKTSVSILPWELSIRAANRFDLKPLPTLQLYSAYTPKLDADTAAAVAERGAEYLIVSHEGVDNRNMLLDTPATWREIMGRYKIIDSDPVERRALLARKAAELEDLNTVNAGRAHLGEWIPVPEIDHLLYDALSLEYSVLGKAARFLYHVPEVQVELKRKSGRTEKYRLLSETAIGGILINYPPADQNDFEDLLQGYGTDPVVQFRVVAPSPYLKQEFGWQLKQSSRRLAIRQEEPKRPEIVAFTLLEAKGRDASFEITVSDGNGARNIQFLQVIVNRDLNGVGACYLSYEAPENRLWLIADSGAGSAGVGKLGESGTLANSQCTVALEGVTARAARDSITLRIPVRFTASFSGSKQAYVDVIDRGGLHPNWESRARWAVN